MVPQFGGKASEADAQALKIIQEAYGPDYKVIQDQKKWAKLFLKGWN